MPAGERSACKKGPGPEDRRAGLCLARAIAGARPSAGSFVPPAPIRELWELTRYRKSLIQERAREANRVHKMLEDAGIKLATVARDVLGTSGRAMLEALVQRHEGPRGLGRVGEGPHADQTPGLAAGAHRPLPPTSRLPHDPDPGPSRPSRRGGGHAERAYATISAPFADAVQRLDTIPGVNQRTAEVLVAEIGVDLNRFPATAISPAGLACAPGITRVPASTDPGRPAKAISGGGGTRWAALGATRTKNSAVAARYRRVLRHRGHKKAIVAVAHNLLVTVYHVLARQTTYQELGAGYYDRRHTERVAAEPSKRSSSRATGSRSTASPDTRVIF